MMFSTNFILPLFNKTYLKSSLAFQEYLSWVSLGKGGDMVDQGNNTYGGQFVINPSGGLISKGHPLGATGL